VDFAGEFQARVGFDAILAHDVVRGEAVVAIFEGFGMLLVSATPGESARAFWFESVEVFVY